MAETRRPLRQAQWLLLVLVSVIAAACQKGDEGGVTIQVLWRSGEGFNGLVSFHEALPGQAVGDTESYEEGETPEAGAEIPGGWIHTEFGRPRNVVIVIRNPSDEPLLFWAAPHLTSPYSALHGLIIRCLCTGDQHLVPARGSWSRVIEVGLNPSARTRGPVLITHVLVEGQIPLPPVDSE